MRRITEKKENGFYKLKEGQEIYGEENGIRLVQIVGEYEDIEEELGIDLVTLFKAMKDGIWIQEVHDKKKTIHVEVTLYHLVGFALPYKKRYDEEGNYFGSVRYFSDCKRTWALTKEELKR